MLRMSRTALYEIVWSKPMTEIAQEFGIRDQHIAQACDHNNIARPSPGHWQKLSHGKAIKRAALRTDAFPAEGIIIIDAAGWRTLQDGVGH